MPKRQPVRVPTRRPSRSTHRFQLDASLSLALAEARQADLEDPHAVEEAAEELFDEVLNAARNVVVRSRARLPRFFAALNEELTVVPAPVRSRLRATCAAEARLLQHILSSAR